MKRLFLLLPISIIAIIVILLAVINFKDTSEQFQSRGNSASPDSQFVYTLKQTPTLEQRRMSNPSAIESIAKQAMPKQDLESLLKKAAELDAKRGKGVFRFAEPIEVDLSAKNSGTWTELPNGNRLWNLRITSEGADSINFGFERYRMPEGGRLTLFKTGEAVSPYRDFTAADNKEHGQLWTPMVKGDDVILEVELPAENQEGFELALKSVNHGFRDAFKIGGDSSGSCNIDVACTNDQTVGSMVSAFADQIRSVAAYTHQGVDTCSGALINNTDNDSTPYFLTAEHCGITTASAGSVVAFFNFENSTCRTPNSAASGGIGNGDTTQFVSGATLRAVYAPSDFCLIEFNQSIPTEYNPFFAGWDRRGNTATMATGIHHPAVAEKRISFELDSVAVVANRDNGSGSTHYRVNDWDFGTTEGGSSGSPLFNENGLIIGDLTGGLAACGNDLYDIYGALSASWTGGGTPATSLSSWLAPSGTAPLTLDGRNHENSLSVTDASVIEGDSGQVSISFTVDIVRSNNDPIVITYATTDGTAVTGEDYLGGTDNLTFATGQTRQTILVPVLGDNTPESDETFILTVSSADIGAVTAVGTILNDDFLEPSIVAPASIPAILRQPLNYQVTATNTPTSYSITSAPAGMTIDGSSGLISWTPTTLGVQTVQVTASNPAGSDSALLTFLVSNPLQDSMDNNFNFFNITLSPWFLQTDTTQDGIDAAQSGQITHNQSSEFSAVIVTTSPDTLNFYWKVSSEQGYDFLNVFINGTVVGRISGDWDWAFVSLPLQAGVNTIKWSYEKDETVSSLDDAAWIDLVSLGSNSNFTPFEQWFLSHVPNGFQSNLELQDYDGDCLTNLEEYAFNSNPSLASSTNPPRILVTQTNQVFTQFLPIRTDVDYRVQTSADLINWNTIATNPGAPNQNANVILPPSGEVNGKQYSRVLVELK